MKWAVSFKNEIDELYENDSVQLRHHSSDTLLHGLDKASRSCKKRCSQLLLQQQQQEPLLLLSEQLNNKNDEMWYDFNQFRWFILFE